MNNEDAWLAAPELGLFVVCDGVGGRAKGEVASAETAEQIRHWVEGETELLAAARLESGADGSLPPALLSRLRTLIRSAIQNACYMIHGMGELDPEHRGMSTTASVMLIAGRTGIVGQVGDSRVYLAREGEISQLTEDHTFVQTQVNAGKMTTEQARRSKLKNIITRAIGQKEWVNVDVTTHALRPGDRVLLCTDGLHDHLDRDIDAVELFAKRKDFDLERAAETAITLANAGGGEDNITALFVELLADTGASADADALPDPLATPLPEFDAGGEAPVERERRA